MKLNIAMLKRQAHRLWWRRGVDIRSLAAREWVLHPETTVRVPPAIHLEGALDRVTRLSPWRSWPAELSSIRGEKIALAASKAHLIERVSIADAFVYAGPAKEQVGYGEERLLLREAEQPLTLQKANLVSTFSGSNFFGAWLLDDLPLELVPRNADDSIGMVTKTYHHEGGYRALLGLPKPRVVRIGRVEELTMYSEPAFNAFKASRYRELRSRMRVNAARGAVGRPLGAYLRRGHIGEPRVLVNEAEVEELLARVGFDIIDTASLSPDEIARRTLGVKIVVGVEGSHLSHAIWTVADDGVFVVLQPPDRFALPYKEFTDSLDMRFAFLVGQKHPDGFSISSSDIEEILNRLPV